MQRFTFLWSKGCWYQSWDHNLFLSLSSAPNPDEMHETPPPSGAGHRGLWAFPGAGGQIPVLVLVPAPLPPCSALSQIVGTCWLCWYFGDFSPHWALLPSPAAAGRTDAPPGAPAGFGAACKENQGICQGSRENKNLGRWYGLDESFGLWKSWKGGMGVTKEGFQPGGKYSWMALLFIGA